MRVLNLAKGNDGRWSAINGRVIYHNIRTLNGRPGQVVRKAAAWGLSGIAVIGIAVGISLALRGTASPLAVASFAAGVVAALVIIIAFVLQVRSDDHSAKRLDQLAEDMRRLAELTQGSIEEARAQRPEPTLSFRTRAFLTSELHWKRIADNRPLELEQILEAAKANALESLPAPASTQATGFGIDLAKIFAIPSITDNDLAAFRQEVETYVGRLGTGLQVYDRWRRSRHRFGGFHLQFANTGKVPATKVHITLEFPASFVCLDKAPTFDLNLPEVPEFKPRTLFPALDLGSLSATVPLLGGFSDIPPHPPAPNLRGPRVMASPPRVEYSIEELFHGRSIEPPKPVVISVDADGTYEIHWSISAGNLPEPIQGTLHLKVTTEELTQPPIDTLEGLGRAPSETPGAWTAGGETKPEEEG